jgi:hypothetical protein
LTLPNSSTGGKNVLVSKGRFFERGRRANHIVAGQY